MVYCGKASQGCQNCRTRRIKCDRIRPECSQCIRVRKPCPGYRDQLSLMFRDESSKVVRKAHAQWGITDSADLGKPSGLASWTTTPCPATSYSPTTKSAPRSATATVDSQRSPGGMRVGKEICATPVEKAIHFYLQHYVIGLPDEPRAGRELQGIRWVHSHETRAAMTAVGLAGLSNLTGDKEMSMLAKHHYGLALRSMASSIQNVASLDVELLLRIVVMMAMYEVTRRRDEPGSPARTHLMGGAAILSSFLPLRHLPAEGPRGLLQMCFSIVASTQGSLQYSSAEPNVMIPAHADLEISEAPLPDVFFSWVSIIDQLVPERDRPSAELINILAQLLQLSACVRRQPLADGQPSTGGAVREALEIADKLESWERRQEGIWAVQERPVDDGDSDDDDDNNNNNNNNRRFPDDAIFESCYHVYSDMYVARVWNHYRWARILVNQLLLESLRRFPVSSSRELSLLAPKRTPPPPPQQQQIFLDTIRQLARDVLVSVPTHYRHPKLQSAHRDRLDKTRPGAAIGIAGIPTLLFEIKVAGCAPGLPRRYRAWALGMLKTVYRDTGMFQAAALAEFVGKAVEEEEGKKNGELSPSLPPCGEGCLG